MGNKEVFTEGKTCDKKHLKFIVAFYQFYDH